MFVCNCEPPRRALLFWLALLTEVPGFTKRNTGDKIIQVACIYRFYIILSTLHYLDKENLVKMIVCYCEPPWRALLFSLAVVTEVPGFTNRNTGDKIIQVAFIYRFYIIFSPFHYLDSKILIKMFLCYCEPP